MEEKGKKLGLWNIIGLGLGGAIGTGIFVLLGYGIAYTGRSISLVVAIGCFFMLLAYWYNLAMPAMFVMKGGDYSMKAMLFNPFMSGVSAWMILVNGLAMSSYSVALALWGDRIFEKCGIRRDEGGDGGKTLEIRGKRRLSARDGGANYQQS